MVLSEYGVGIGSWWGWGWRIGKFYKVWEISQLDKEAANYWIYKYIFITNIYKVIR